MILFISRTAIQACFPSVHNFEIKLLQYIPEKFNLPRSDLPTSERLSKNCHSSEATNLQGGTNCLKTKHHHRRKALNSNQSKSLDTSRHLQEFLVPKAHEKSLRCLCGGPQLAVNGLKKQIKDSTEMERRKEILHFKY